MSIIHVENFSLEIKDRIVEEETFQDLHLYIETDIGDMHYTIHRDARYPDINFIYNLFIEGLKQGGNINISEYSERYYIYVKFENNDISHQFTAHKYNIDNGEMIF